MIQNGGTITNEAFTRFGKVPKKLDPQMRSYEVEIGIAKAVIKEMEELYHTDNASSM